jgi:hypothetical protein
LEQEHNNPKQMELWLVTSVVGIAKSVPQANKKFTFAIMQLLDSHGDSGHDFNLYRRIKINIL